uniref:Uncharacterized protein n=1 Tax=Anopheles christyi TaxID=43041 RepID=A0A182KI19_9DIPT
HKHKHTHIGNQPPLQHGSLSFFSLAVRFFLCFLPVVTFTFRSDSVSEQRVVSCISILVVGSLIGEAVLLPRGPAYDLRIFGSGWAAVTTIPPVRNLLPGLTPGDGTPAARPLPLGRSAGPLLPLPFGPADKGPAG